MAMDSTDAPQMIEHIQKSVGFTPHDTKWIPCSARFVACGVAPNSQGHLGIYELSKGELKINFENSKFRPHGIKCATFGASRIENRHIAIGDYQGGLSICDLDQCSNRNDKCSNVYSVKAHQSMVNCIDGISGSSVGNGAPEIVTGSKDGLVKVWDPRVDYPVASFEPEEGTGVRDCWAVSFGDSYNNEERCVCAGYDNGDVKLFDLRKNTLRWETKCENGVTSLEFDRKDIEMNKLVITTLESKFICYDMRTQHNTEGFSCIHEKAHRSTVWLCQHLPQNRDVFMTAGGNGGFNIYKYHYPFNRVGKHKQDGTAIGIMGTVELLNSRVISTQPIISFDWSPDRAGLCCLGSLDQSLRVYIVTKLDKY